MMLCGEYICPIFGKKIELPEKLACPNCELLYCGTIHVGTAKGYLFSSSLDQVMDESDHYLGKFGLQCGYLEVPNQLRNEAKEAVTVIGVMDHIEVYPRSLPAFDVEDEISIHKMIDDGERLGEALEHAIDEINAALECEKQ